MDNNELKPCPFCGGKAWIIRKTYRKWFKKKKYWFARCECCRATSGVEFTEIDVKKAWNRRAE